MPSDEKAHFFGFAPGFFSAFAMEFAASSTDIPGGAKGGSGTRPQALNSRTNKKGTRSKPRSGVITASPQMQAVRLETEKQTARTDK